ncbi:MAG: alpha/beta fold hydrolase [Solirubrobacterales bacterium]
MSAPVHHRHADVGEISMHYAEAGQGAPILFLHGFPQFWFLWRHQLADLGRDFHCVAPDLRGFNLSDKPKDPDSYRMRHLLGDVDGLLDHLGWERFTLVGHDWGGIVSWAWALKHPERLDGFVILDSPPPFTWSRDLRNSAAQREAVSYMLDLSEPSPGPEEKLAADDFRFLFSMLERIGGDNSELNEQERAAYREAWAQPGALRGGVNYYRAARMGDQVAAGGVPEEYERKITAQRLEVPTQVIWGEDDPALLVHLTEGLEQWVPDIRVTRLAGAGHWVPYERPAEVNALIRERASG